MTAIQGIKHWKLSLTVAIILITFQVVHTFFLVVMGSIFETWWLKAPEAIFAAIGVNVGLLIFTVKGKIKIATAFMWLEITINLFYTLLALVFTGDEIIISTITHRTYLKIIANLVIGCGIPIIIKTFAGEIDDKDDITALGDLNLKIEALEAKIQESLSGSFKMDIIQDVKKQDNLIDEIKLTKLK